MAQKRGFIPWRERSIVLVLIALLWHSRVLFFVSFNPFAGQEEIRYEERMVSASKEDSVRLCTLLYGKGLHYDNSSCGFRAGGQHLFWL